jgi:hypothetical protein
VFRLLTPNIIDIGSVVPKIRDGNGRKEMASPL